jgi:hypothetical protein
MSRSDTTSGTEADLTADPDNGTVLGAAFVAPADGIYKLAYNLSNLSPYASSFTVHVLHRAADDTLLRRFSGVESKWIASETVFGDDFQPIVMLAGEKLELAIFSTNEDDDDVNWRRVVVDAMYGLAVDGSGQVPANNAVADSGSVVVAPVGNEILIRTDVGLAAELVALGRTLHFAIWRLSDNCRLNGNTFEADTGNDADYVVDNLIHSGGGRWTGDFPTLAAGAYDVIGVYQNADDQWVYMGWDRVTWNGTRRVSPTASVEDFTSPSATEIADAMAGRVNVIIHSPATGFNLDLFRGDAYLDAQGTAITITKKPTETHWPSVLNDVVFDAKPTAGLLEIAPDAASLTGIACTITQATGDDQAFTLELTAADTATLAYNAAIKTGGYTFRLVANSSNPTTTKTLRAGILTVLPDRSAA